MTSPIFSSLRGVTTTRYRNAIWISRVLGLAVTALYFTAWWDESMARQEPLLGGAANPSLIYTWAVFTHLLPAVAILLFTVVGWNRPGLAGIGFALFALLQAFTVGTEIAYLPIVVAPGLIVAIAFATAYRWGRSDQFLEKNS
jgi:hypothetical protein